MPITSRQVGRSAGEKLNIHLAGIVAGGELISEVLVDPAEYEAKHARLMTVFHSLQTGLVALLFWECDSGEDKLILPIEGRGALSFDRFDGLQNPRTEGMTGRILLRIYNPNPDNADRHWALSFELHKQRS